MKIKLLTPVASAAGVFNVGETIDLPSEEARAYIELGYAEPLADAPKIENAMRTNQASKSKG